MRIGELSRQYLEDNEQKNAALSLALLTVDERTDL